MSGRDLRAENRRQPYGQAENPFLFPALAGVAAIFTGLIFALLAVCYVLMVRDPGYGFRPSAEIVAKAEPAVSANSADDPDGALHIGFIDGQQSYFYRKNQQAGNILILTGQVRNDYLEPRSFIRLRGVLLTSDEKTLADRFAYAGNFLSEEELTGLPLGEILARLQIKGGQDGVNLNVPPGAALRFMLVFDNLPDGLDQYRIDAVGSEPAR